MKKQVLMYSCLLAVMLSIIITFSACTKQENRKDQLSRNGNITLENLYEITSKYYPSDRNITYILSVGYQHDGETTQEVLLNTYRLGFHFRDDTAKDENGYVVDWGMVLEPCNSTLKYDYYDRYPIYNRSSSKPSNFNSEPLYSVYFKIEDLEKIEYITKDRNKQKNLCLFKKDKTGGMGLEVSISSNKLIYTAKEINSIMDEYEGLR